MSEKRQHVHELIDRLPEAHLSTALGLLEKILDPVALAALNACIDGEPEEEEEKLAVAAAEDWLKRTGGKGIPHEEVMRRLGL